MQCTKGKCSKAFHVSCARENPAIVFDMKEVEKEVILTDSAVAPMELGAGIGVPMEKSDQVLKVIKKLEVQILCSQHNPVRRIFCNENDGVLTSVRSGRGGREEG